MTGPRGRARRWEPFAETVFTEFSALAAAHGAINLGQGSPGFDGPHFVKDAAAAAIARGDNQYAPMAGIPELKEVVARRFAAATGIPAGPDHVTVTSGCAEALAACFLGLVDPGDEVVLIEPFYDLYPAGIGMSGGVRRHVTLRPPDFRLDATDLATVVNPRTRLIVLNTPHNPVGRVFDRAELELVATVAEANDAVVVADEVYEHLVFDGEHISIASLPGMWDRTLTLSSLGKTFSLTGWKIGWAVGPDHLTDAVRAAHQFLTFAVPTPLQHGAVAALNAPPEYFEEFVAGYRRRRDILVAGLHDAGFAVSPPEGTYFALADHTAFGFADDVACARYLTTEVGVGAIPPGSFYDDPADGASLVRFSFCQPEDRLIEAVRRLETLKTRPATPLLVSGPASPRRA